MSDLIAQQRLEYAASLQNDIEREEREVAEEMAGGVGVGLAEVGTLSNHPVGTTPKTVASDVTPMGTIEPGPIGSEPAEAANPTPSELRTLRAAYFARLEKRMAPRKQLRSGRSY